ncbi:MAG: histidine phosphatase family protein, partial [Oscillospiraceae bacterium]|nr:histidine phosphatase family protein [Oscillospiraceae bacterium]
MTTVYFIRHAESDIAHRDGRTRPLTDKGLAERGLVAEFLNDKDIGAVLSSPFKRSVDTVSPFATSAGLEIETDEGFRERASDSDWLR